MAGFGTSSDIADLKNHLIRLITHRNIINRNPIWICLDRLWWEVDDRHEFSNLLTAYIQLFIKNESKENIVIVTPDTISSSYGISPAVFLAAEQLKVPVSVWQELGNFAEMKPILTGTERTNLRCLVIQDVIRYGNTILKIHKSIKRRQWSLIGYVCVVLNCPDKSKLEKTKDEYYNLTSEELMIHHLININELTKSGY